jgi:phosphoglycerol transferase
MHMVVKPYWFGLALSLVSTLLLSWFVYQFHMYAIEVPRGYQGDAFFSAMVIKQAITNPFATTQPFLGFPFGQQLTDFPATDTTNTVLVLILSLLSSDPWVLSNLFLLLGFLLCTLSAYSVFYQLKLPVYASILGSLVFSFLPYHFIRGPYHLFLGNYWLIPFIGWLCLWLLTKQAPVRWSFRTLALISLLGIAIGGSGLYYALFAIGLVGISGSLAYIKHRQLSPFLICLWFGVVTVSWIGVQSWPTLSYNRQHGPNQIIGERQAFEADNNSLQLIRMIMPLESYGLPFLTEQSFDAEHPLLNMEKRQYLGLAALLGLVVIGLRQLIFPHPSAEKQVQWWALFLLVGCIFLISMPGGIGTIIAYVITPQIRAYGRIQPFLAFFLLTGTLLFFDEWQQRRAGHKWLVAAGFSMISLYFQISWFTSPMDSIVPQYQSDSDFFQFISQTAPTAIYQLPYKAFPETPPIHKLGDYDLLKGYLLTQTPTAWSYASLKGRGGDEWLATLSQFPVEVQALIAKENGFDGILIDSFGYTDAGQAVQASLSAWLTSPGVVSSDRRLFYYEL